MGTDLAQLRSRGLAPWDTTAIPERVQWSLVRYVARLLIASFGIVGERAQRLRLGAEESLRDLERDAASPDPHVRVQAPQY